MKKFLKMDKIKQIYKLLDKQTGWSRLRKKNHYLYKRLIKLKVCIDCESICWICGKEVDYYVATLDHMIPKSRNFTDYHPNSYWISHELCNSQRQDKSIIKSILTYKQNGKLNLPNPIKVNKNNSVIEILKQLNYIEKYNPQIINVKLSQLNRIISRREKYINYILQGNN